MIVDLRILPDRIRSRIVTDGPVPPEPLRPIDTPCWLWTGWHSTAGYPYVEWEGRSQPAHRVVHFLLTGEDLTGFERDHVCRVVGCVRPDHGERVTHAENQRRLSEAQKACRRAGHDWTDPRNVYVRRNGRRWCAECSRLDRRENYQPSDREDSAHEHGDVRRYGQGCRCADCRVARAAYMRDWRRGRKAS